MKSKFYAAILILLSQQIFAQVPEEAIRLQKNLIEKTTYDPVTQKARYTSLSKIYWSFGNKEEAILAAEKAQNPGLLKFYRQGDHKMLEKDI